MSIDVIAAIMIGLPRCEVSQELLDNGDLDVAPYYYDGGSEDDAIAGFQYCCASYGATELVWDKERIDSCKESFKILTGLDAKIYLTPYVF